MRIVRFIAPLVIVLALLAVWGKVAEHNALAAIAALPTPVLPDRGAANIADITEPAEEDSAETIALEIVLPDDPYVASQWALTYIGMDELWRTAAGADIVVAVLDTGIEGDHEDLSGKVVDAANFSDSSTANDQHGHGTHVAGIIAAYSDNGLGVAGIAPESGLLNVKVADDNGRCQASAVAEGIIWAVDNGASVINVSIELREPSAALEAAVNYAWENGALVIAAAGNDGSQSPVYPAYYQNCIAVAAVEEDDSLAVLSNYGDWVDVAAPGDDIYSTLPGDQYGYKSGTSFATAYVSGLAAILFGTLEDSNDDGNLNDEVRAALEGSCQGIDIDGVGWGRIDAASLAALL